MTLRCAIYTRKSTEEGLDQAFNSLDAQREACEAFIKSQAHEGWRLAPRRYDDGGYSGGNMQRPGLARLLADVKDKRIDVIVVYKVDRLTRSLADFARIVDQLDASKVSFVAVTQSFNTTTSMGRLTLNMLLSFAQFEREITGERIRDKIAASKARGIWMGGTPPLGYRPEGRALIIIPNEAELVRRMFRRFVELGEVSALRRELNAAGERSRIYIAGQGRVGRIVPFSVASLLSILRNPVYIGEVVHKGVRHPGLHQPIVPREDWKAAQAHLMERKPRGLGAGARDMDFVLRGLVCDVAGRPLKLSLTQSAGGRLHRYYQSRGAAEAPILRPPASKLEPAVERVLVDNLPSAEQRAWRDLSITKRSRRLRKCVKRVLVSEDMLQVTLYLRHVDPSAPRRRGRPRKGEAGPVITKAVPIKFGRPTAFAVVTPPDNAGPISGKPDRLLIDAVAKAHLMRARLERGKIVRMADLALAEGIELSELERRLQLAYLSPDVTVAVLEGRQAPSTTLEHISSQALPASWADQALGFLAPTRA
jgi:DNA invertase Pin-like site-specific DNA recombinase